MKEENLVVISLKQKKYSSYIGEISPEVPNLIARDFHAEKPNIKWLTDITEFHIPSGKVYLSPIIDYRAHWIRVSSEFGENQSVPGDYDNKELNRLLIISRYRDIIFSLEELI